MAKDKNKKITIKLTKSLIGATKKQLRVASALGLRKTNQEVEHYDSPTIMGMVNAIPHLVTVVS